MYVRYYSRDTWVRFACVSPAPVVDMDISPL